MNFKETYNRNDFLDFINEIIPDFDEDTRPIRLEQNYHALKKAKFLGTSRDLDLSVIELKIEGKAEKKIYQAKEGFRLMKEHQIYRALVVYEGDTDWRLSLMTMGVDKTATGRTTQKYSNPRRFSFYLGPQAKTKTPEKFLITKGKIKNFDDLLSRFSVEVVNKEFYQRIAIFFSRLTGGDRKTGTTKQHYKPEMTLPSISTEDKKTYQEFSVRLLGRIIFCWFLKQKESSKGISLFPDEFLSSRAVNSGNYYHSILEPVFFEVLNRPIESRKSEYRNGYDKIPYLNGGLFDPHGDDFYEGQPKFNLKIPDGWFRDLFEVLETYNFTIDENTTLDVDLSIDPEMLGRIFENLLAEINPETGESARKSTGSYYTPRQIVEYMVDQSLVQYLTTKTGMLKEKVEALISIGTEDDEKYPLSDEENKKVVNALDEVKIIDPACGSGAFPIGILQKIVWILGKVDISGKLWFDKKLIDLDPLLHDDFKQKFENENFDYIRKTGVIRDSIYGVDIQPIAVEVSKLRSFLTLIVDEDIDETKPNRGIKPLPNLEFKFVAANSLISLPKSADFNNRQAEMFESTEEINKLKTIRDKYFTSTGFNKDQCKAEFDKTRIEMFQSQRDKHFNGTLTNALADWDPFSDKASSWFDPKWMFGIEQFGILIGNPPWGQKSVKFSKQDIKMLTRLLPSTKVGAKDISRFFIEASINFLKSGGIFTNILPDIILLKNYDSTRKFMLDNLAMLNLDHWGNCFENVNLESFTIVSRKESGSNKNSVITTKIRSDNKETRKILQNKFDKLDGYKFNLYYDENKQLLIKKLSQWGVFADILEPHEGIHTGNIRRKIISINNTGSKFKKFILGGNEVTRYNIKWSGRYVHYDPAIINKGAGEYAGLGRPSYFDGEKIVIRRTGDYVLAALDKSGYYFSNNLFVCQAKNSAINLTYVLGLLNSKVSTWFYRAIQPREGKLFAELKINLLKRMPLRVSEEYADKVSKIVNNIIEKKDNRIILENKLNRIVYQIYELTDDEISIIDRSSK